MPLSPVWRRAPGRAWRRGGSGPLVLLAVLAAATSAASGPMFVQTSGDDALATVRAAIPDSARTSDSDSVRLVSGAAPTNESQLLAVQSMAALPGTTGTSVVAFSVTPEVRWSDFVRPVVRSTDGVAQRARLAAVEDPRTSLVVADEAGSTGTGVWLPEPLADDLGVEPGGTVELLIQTSDATHARPKDAPPDPVARVRVDGTYAVGTDDRRPADPAGTAAWSRRVGGIPSDTEFNSLASYLVVADVATAERLAEVTGDSLLWTVETSMRPGLTLAEAQQTSAAVASLREQVRAPSDEPPGPLRTGLVSGAEDVVATAVSLRDATRDRAGLLASAGAVTGLLALLVVLVLVVGDRRIELRHGAAVGIGPVRTAGTWVLEALVPVALAAAGGVLLARAALTVLGPQAGVSDAAVQDAVRAAARVGAIGLVIVATVAAAGVLLADRPHPARRRRALPWVWLLVVAAGTALLTTATTAAVSPGPVALVTPSLVALATGAVIATIAARLGRSRRTSLPSSAGAAGRWIGRRRTAGAGPEWVLPVAVLALGLGVVMVTATAVAGTRTVITDRVAVRSGAESTAQILGTWELDEDAAQAPSAKDVNEGVPVPVPPPVRTPAGTTVVWRTLASVEGGFGYHDVMAIDPDGFGEAASWGVGRHLAETRQLLERLDDPGDGSADLVPVIAVNDPSVRVGQTVVMSGQEWQAPVVVVAVTDSFPGLDSRPLMIARADDLLVRWGRSDPRLLPPKDLVPIAYSETWLWSAEPLPQLLRTADRADATVVASTSPAQLALDPALDAASRSLGYLVALAAFVAITSLVVLAEQARRTARRTRAADAMLARIGLGARGVRAARTWELGWSVVVALVSAVAATLLVTPIAAGLFDLDRAARPGFEFRLDGAALAITAGTALVGFLLALWAASRGSRSAEEVVLRDG